jgi:CRP/FNR family transcriptional regulator, cyclic AMP receptor protein
MDAGTIDQLLGGRVPASTVRFQAGSYLFHEGDPADRLFLVRRGRVALELLVPGRGPLIVDTVQAGELLGVSWLFPPYRWQLDARAVKPVEALAADGAALRAACEQDPRFGYQLTQRIGAVMQHRLQSARVRLLDLYGHASAG